MKMVAAAPGLVKVQLSFKTWEPVHIRSHVLKTEFKAPPPFIETLTVWLRPDEVFPRLSAYNRIFDRLCTEGIISSKAQLHNFNILEEDETTLAYLEEELA